MDKYIKTSKALGQGGYGSVRLAHVKNPDGTEGRPVAIKKLHTTTTNLEGIEISTIREIRILKDMHHKNIVELIDVIAWERQIYLVMECCETDLYRVINNMSVVLSSADVKCYLKQILEAVEFCHKCWILHRDLKPGNLLITKEGIVKLTDFGLAKNFAITKESLSPRVITIWYRAPEMLFGSDKYSSSIDMWSVGCIFAELMLRAPLFPGISEIDMLSRICAALGTPNEKRWPGVSSLPCFIEFAESLGTPLESIFVGATPDALDLISEMLCLDPAKRISASKALQHPYFQNLPAPTHPSKLVLSSAEPKSAPVQSRRNHAYSGECSLARKKIQWN
ncbi:cyclin-dependent kinase 7-like [Schistocerca gregaria]|uniref:cyclin-dependent kinase 7-like n=1 Tax=Schistocerca gregaria TaxID=7010 RepID=UPI00211EDA58|nr:cyclin-dependent kinase 7-like [Schistocerca gregaria]